MKAALLAVALVLAPATVLADPITTGVWTPVAEGPAGADGNGEPFWDGRSWDGSTMGIGYLLAACAGTDLEYLGDGSGGAAAFRFEAPVITTHTLYQVTAWQSGTLARRADGAFVYDSGTGRVSNSWEHGGQYALFRIAGPEITQYFLGIEDILLSETLNDRDYNDTVVSFAVPTSSVPEPSSAALMLTAILAGAVQRSFRRACPRAR
jgi:hypothetical protein